MDLGLRDMLNERSFTVVTIAMENAALWRFVLDISGIVSRLVTLHTYIQSKYLNTSCILDWAYFTEVSVNTSNTLNGKSTINLVAIHGAHQALPSFMLF